MFHIGGDLAFIHIPKTGGTWLKKMMPHKQRHGFIHEIVKRPDPSWTTFTIVRHPVCWLVSLWGQVQRHGVGMKQSPACVLEQRSHKEQPLDEFINIYLADHKGEIGRIFDAYLQEADVVIHNETIRFDLPLLLDKHGLLNTAIARQIAMSQPHNVMALNLNREVKPDLYEAIMDAESDFNYRWGYK